MQKIRNTEGVFMLGIIYCLLAVLIGKEAAEMFFASGDGKNNKFWILSCGAFGTGILIFGWSTYMISWAASALGAQKPLFYGNVFVMALSLVFLIFLYTMRYRRDNTILSGYERELIRDKKQFRVEVIFFVILAVFISWIMFYVFYIKDGVLYSGYTVYGDYAPHTAMIRSFSLGNNFPTQYPHFGGQDVKYHFMFQFLVGNLEFLGLRLDLAYNLVSILALLAFLIMLYNLALRITRSLTASVCTILFFFFRSALTFFQFVIEHLVAGDLAETFKIMDPAQIFQFFCLGRLHTDTETVDSCRVKIPKFLCAGRPRIHLHGDLRVLCHCELLSDTVHQLPDLFPGQQRRRTSSDKYTGHGTVTVIFCSSPDLCKKCSHIGFPCLLRGRGRQEITIAALSYAKG